MTLVLPGTDERRSLDGANAPRVLIVDDNPANLVALRAVLRPLGAEIVEAVSGAEAIEVAGTGSFALALLDVQMPSMDGFETAAALRATERGRELPIIFVTAIASEERYEKKGYAAGAADYITKPYDADVLRARVKAFVDLFRQREELRRHDVLQRTRERDEAVRRLAALERITTAALEEGDVEGFLRKLLGAFIEASDSAESGIILLREGHELRVHAAVGPASPPLGATVLADALTADRSTMDLLAPVNGCRLPSGEHADRSPSGSVFRIPLLYDGEAVGMAEVGSNKRTGFTEPEKRLFSAMAARAAWAVARRHELDRFHAVLMSAPVLVSIVSASRQTCEFANQAVRRMFGRNVEGKTAAQLGATREMQAMLERVAGTGETLMLHEHRVAFDWQDDGHVEERYFNFSFQPLRGSYGEVASVLCFWTDVTITVRGRVALEFAAQERAMLLENERTARAAAELANRSKDDFLATISHELRTPLNAILGWTVIAQRTAPDDLQRALTVIERNARAQSRIIEDVLDVSRIIGGNLRLSFSRVDVRAVLQSALDAARPAADTKGVTLTASLAELGIIVADLDRLTQVIGNLLSNAVKFTPRGGHVHLSSERSDSHIVIRVKDDGQGIDPAFRPHLFEAFRQGDGSTTRRHGGLGLGLAIAKQLTTAHGGTILADSEGHMRGSNFTVEIPCRSPGEVFRERPSERSLDPLPDRLRGVRLLVVDDEKDSRELVGELFREYGAAVTCAASAREALEQIGRLRPDVLISDIGMPETDGFGLIRQVRGLPVEQGGKTPAIALTAYAHPDDLRRAFEVGFQLHLAKPVDPNGLIAAVASLAGISDTRS